MAAYNARFAKPPRSPFDAHRPLREDEDLDAILTWRVQRKVSDALTLQNDRAIYLLENTRANRRWIGRYLEVWEYPDGRLEIRADGVALACRRYDKLAEIDQGAVIGHKRLGHALQVAQALQAQRDTRRTSGSPSRTNRGMPVRAKDRQPGTKKPGEIMQEDLNAAVRATRWQPASQGRKRPDCRACDAEPAWPTGRRVKGGCAGLTSALDAFSVRAMPSPGKT